MNLMRFVRFGVLRAEAGLPMQSRWSLTEEVLDSFTSLEHEQLLLANLKGELMTVCLTKPWKRISGDADRGIGSTGFLFDFDVLGDFLLEPELFAEPERPGMPLGMSMTDKKNKCRAASGMYTGTAIL